MIKLDISTGIDPVPITYDIFTDEISFRVDGTVHKWPLHCLPFTLKEMKVHGHSMRCADKALILRHANG